MSGTQTRPDEPGQQKHGDEAALTGLAGAAGRDQYVGAQIAKAEQAARTQPATAFDGEVYRSLNARFASAVADHSHSGPGRYNAVGQSAFYATPTLGAVKAEAHNYEAVNGKSASGLEGKSVVRGTFQGEVLDLRATPGVSPSALMQPHGYQGRMRDTLSRVTGEDAYTLPRALGDVARERNLSGVIAPANGTSVNYALFPDNPNRPTTGPGRVESGYHPIDYTTFDATGPIATGRFNAPHANVADTRPNASSPLGVDLGGTPKGLQGYAELVGSDAHAHTRAAGERYGAAGALTVSLAEGVVAGHVDGKKIAADTALGAASARAETSLAHGLERAFTAAPVPPNVAGVTSGLEANAAARAAIRPPTLAAGAGAAGVVGAVIAGGVTTWQDADAVKTHKMTAGQATADVAVQTGIGLGSGAAGAATGAAVGSVVPVAGTAVGAVVGFGVGMGAGYVAQHSHAVHEAQRAAGEYLTRHYEQPLQHAWQHVSNVVDRVNTATTNGWNAVEHAASGTLASAESEASSLFGRLRGATAAPQSQAEPAHPSPHSQPSPWAASTRSDHTPTPAHEAEAARSPWQRLASSASTPAPAHPAEQQARQQGIGLRR